MCFISYTYTVVEATSDSLSPDPQLPLARLAVPRGALVVPAPVSEWIIEAIEGLSVDRHRNETGLWGVGDPHLDFAIITIHWKQRKKWREQVADQLQMVIIIVIPISTVSQSRRSTVKLSV